MEADVVRGVFLIDAHDREIIARRAVMNAGNSGSDIRDLLLEAMEGRFSVLRAPVVMRFSSTMADPTSPRVRRYSSASSV